jgi:hypothetical protein
VGVFYDDRIQEVLVQMVYVLEDTVLQKGANTYVVEYREELHVLAQAAAGSLAISNAQQECRDCALLLG